MLVSSSVLSNLGACLIKYYKKRREHVRTPLKDNRHIQAEAKWGYWKRKCLINSKSIRKPHQCDCHTNQTWLWKLVLCIPCGMWEYAGHTLCFLLQTCWPHLVVTRLHLKGFAMVWRSMRSIMATNQWRTQPSVLRDSFLLPFPNPHCMATDCCGATCHYLTQTHFQSICLFSLRDICNNEFHHFPMA